MIEAEIKEIRELTDRIHVSADNVPNWTNLINVLVKINKALVSIDRQLAQMEDNNVV